jgi:GNAT superfamily N-acetyltransferase
VTALLRPAGESDVPAVARLFALSRQVALPFLPVLHGPDEDLDFFAAYLRRGRITLAEEDEHLLGFLAESPGWIDHLYLHPESRGLGIGTQLLEQAQSRQDHLQLWCFEQNAPACAFYCSRGFAEVRRTAGENEERLPDILFVWRRDW